VSGKEKLDPTPQLETLREQQRAISGVLRAVARFARLQPVLDEVVEACSRLCDADNAALWLLDDGLLHSVADHGEPEGAAYDRQNPHPLDRTTLAGRTAVTRHTVHIPDVDADPEYAYRGPRPYRAMLGVPVIVEATSSASSSSTARSSAHSATSTSRSPRRSLTRPRSRSRTHGSSKRSSVSAPSSRASSLPRSPRSFRAMQADPRGPSRLHHSRLLRPKGVHGVRRVRRAGGAHRRRSRVPRSGG
jgi:GAF domain